MPFKFKYNTNELVISDGSALDFETKSTWIFKVQVSDGELSTSATVTVKLTDVKQTKRL
ncbi:MAG: cadherin repeat domain-containing protein [Bacteroidales bacterium]|nr:cadherin repeat domain-containing protein [Bacteroidales bacterium]